MSFKLLKQVIAHLKLKSSCPFCKGRFSDDDIFVLATSFDAYSAAANGLFMIICPKCNASAFIIVESANIHARQIKIKPAQSTISPNDILDMHNFLKNWEGDVKELFI